MSTKVPSDPLYTMMDGSYLVEGQDPSSKLNPAYTRVTHLVIPWIMLSSQNLDMILLHLKTSLKKLMDADVSLCVIKLKIFYKKHNSGHYHQ